MSSETKAETSVSLILTDANDAQIVKKKAKKTIAGLVVYHIFIFIYTVGVILIASLFTTILMLDEVKYGRCAKHIKISKGVLDLKDHLYENCKIAKAVTFPEGLISIGRSCFANSNIEAVTMPKSVAFIGMYALSGCSLLKNISMPGVERIEPYAFYNNTSLETVTLSDNIISIYSNAFENCSSLKQINLSDNITALGDSVFKGCTSLSTIHIPKNIFRIPYSLFESCTNLVKVDITGEVDLIKKWAFYNCASLEEITIPGEAVTIENNAFYGCTKLQSINAKVENIRGSAFENCSSLTKFESLVDHGSTWPLIVYIDNFAFQNCTSLETVEIPYASIDVGVETFAGCSKLKTVTSKYFLNLKERAFKDCVSLTKCDVSHMPGDMPEGLFMGCTSLTSITIRESKNLIPADFCNGCTRLESINLPKSLSTVGPRAFSNSGLTEIVLPESCHTIMDYGFSNCYNLATVDFGNIRRIGSGAFQNCPTLTSISLPNTVSFIAEYAFSGCSQLRIANLQVAEAIDNIPIGMFEGCNELEQIEIPNQISTISDKAFKNTGLSSVKINASSNLTEICDEAFMGCRSLTKITLPEKIKIIGIKSFFESSLKYACFRGQEGSATINATSFPEECEVVWDYREVKDGAV